MRGRRQRITALLAIALLAAGVGVAAYATHLLRRSELQTIDARFSIRGKRKAPSNIVLVQIDNATLQQLKHTQFPFPRRYDASVIDHLQRGGAAAIALDLEFTQQTDARDDDALIEALEKAPGRTVLAASQIGAGGQTGVLGGGSLLRELKARAADDRLVLDSDGVVRRFARSQSGLNSMPVVAVEVARRRPVPASLFGGGTLPIDFVGASESYESISYSKVLKGEFAARLFAGKIAIVGASAPILGDVHATATSGSRTMPGDEVIANAASTLLRGVPLRDASGAIDIVLIALLGLAVPLGSLRLRGWRALMLGVVLAGVFAVAVQIAFDSGLIITFVYPLLALALGTFGTLVTLYLREAIERERVRDVFSRFVPAGVVDEVLASADENLRLGGVERDCTVLFSDLRGFTSFSETQPAARVIEVVNCYLNEMSEAILAAGGTLIAYMGDGIMAVSARRWSRTITPIARSRPRAR